MSLALVVDAVVDAGKIRILDEDYYRTRASRAAKKWGDGTPLKVRIEPEPDAKTHAQLKYFHGYVLEPMVNYTGDIDMKLQMKFMFLADWQTSLADLSYEEMKVFTEKAQAWARTVCPEAFEKYGREYVA